jgi:hypothetical protein
VEMMHALPSRELIFIGTIVVVLLILAASAT